MNENDLEKEKSQKSVDSQPTGSTPKPPKKSNSYLYWLLGIGALISFGIYWYYKADIYLTIASYVFLAGLTALTFHLRKDENSTFEQITNSIKNVIEICALLLGGFLVYNSTWFDKFYTNRDVVITGEVYETTINKSFEKEIEKVSADRTLVANDTVKLVYTFYSDNPNYNELPIKVKAISGKIHHLIQLDRAYVRASVKCDSGDFSIYKSKADVQDTQIKKAPIRHGVLLLGADVIKQNNNNNTAENN